MFGLLCLKFSSLYWSTPVCADWFSSRILVLLFLQIMEFPRSGKSAAAAAAAGVATPPVAKPVFVRAGQGLRLQETERGIAARSAVARSKQGQVGVAMAKSAAVVRAQAVARVSAAGGDAADDLLVLSASVLQFGQYRGQTFRWLLENAVGYACSIVRSCEAEALAAPAGQRVSALAANKAALCRYVVAYPEMRDEMVYTGKVCIIVYI